jgi:hypothetical protein
VQRFARDAMQILTTPSGNPHTSKLSRESGWLSKGVKAATDPVLNTSIPVAIRIKSNATRM